jgi:hypothetical protein
MVNIEGNSHNMWIRARFQANLVDPRPMLWPPPGPYWISGEGDGYSIVIAYVKTYKEILKYWPDATDIDCNELCDKITYSSRFPKPSWYEQ